MIELHYKGKKVKEFETVNIEKVIDQMQEEAHKANPTIFNSRNLWKVVGNKLTHETMVSYSEFEIVGDYKSIPKEYPKED